MAATEWHHLFRRNAIRRRLEELRRLLRGLHVEGTNICNASCVFCAYPQMERRKTTMSMEDFRAVVDAYVSMGGRSVSLTPIVGDPFVDKHMFERLDDLMAREEIRSMSFYTNAILMTREKSERLMAYADKLHVHVSWGGFDAATWNEIMGVSKFEAARDAVLDFLDVKASTGTEIPFTLALRCPRSACHGELWDRLSELEARGLVEIADMPDYDSWAGKVTPEALESVGLKPRTMPYKRGACELLFTKPVVLANGDVNACAVGTWRPSSWSATSRNSLAEIWAGKGIDDLIEQHEAGDYLTCAGAAPTSSASTTRARAARSPGMGSPPELGQD